MRILRPTVLLGTALAALLSACGEEVSVSEQVKAAIAEMEKLGESGERGAFMDFITADFQGQGGQLTHDDFGRLLVLQWNQNRRINAQLFPIDVTELGPTLATAKFRMLLTGGSGWLPERGQLYEVETSWQKEDGDWKLWQATWAPVSL
jgi:hypothetical protein